MTNSIIVVGNGIIGSTLAFTLLEKGHRVSLVSPHADSGQSATLAAGAMLGVLGEVTHDELKPVHRIEFEARLRSYRLYKNLFEGLSSATGTEIRGKKGTFIVATNVGHEDVPNINAMKALGDEYDLGAEWVEPEDIAWYHPNSGNIARKMLFLADEESIPSARLLSTLQNALSRYGGSSLSIVPHHVESLIVDQETVTGVTLDNGVKITGDWVALCAGYRTHTILKNSPLPADLFPKILGGKGTSLIVEATNQDSTLDYVFRTPNRDFACGTHVVPMDNGSVYVGATNRMIDPLLQDVNPSMGELHTLTHSCIHEINTFIRTSEIRSIRCGVRPFTSDGSPLVGKSDIDGLCMGTGTYRNGILFAPLIANLISNEIETDAVGLDNPYSAQKQFRRPGGSKREIIENGVRHLISFMQDPHGRLPYNREKELEKLVTIFARAAFLKDQDAIAAIDALSESLEGYQIQEVIPDMFYKLQNTPEKLYR